MEGSEDPNAAEDARRAAIEAAAREVPDERAYRRTSMPVVAERARASDRTMYRRYGSEEALVAALIHRDADGAARSLEGREGRPRRMHAFGTALPPVLTGERAVALNRAAAADASETGELGRELARSARARVLPRRYAATETARAAPRSRR